MTGLRCSVSQLPPSSRHLTVRLLRARAHGSGPGHLHDGPSGLTHSHHFEKGDIVELPVTLSIVRIFHPPPPESAEPLPPAKEPPPAPPPKKGARAPCTQWAARLSLLPDSHACSVPRPPLYLSPWFLYL